MFLKCLFIPGFCIVIALCENNTIETSITGVPNKKNALNETNLSEREDTVKNHSETSNKTDVINVRPTSNKADESNKSNETNFTAVSTDVKLYLNNNNITFNGTTHLNYTENRKAVLIINQPSALRNGKKKSKSKKGKSDTSHDKVETLLYEEYNSDKTKLAEFMMYNMEDVSKFFASYLHTEICNVKCVADE